MAKEVAEKIRGMDDLVVVFEDQKNMYNSHLTEQEKASNQLKSENMKLQEENAVLEEQVAYKTKVEEELIAAFEQENKKYNIHLKEQKEELEIKLRYKLTKLKEEQKVSADNARAVQKEMKDKVTHQMNTITCANTRLEEENISLFKQISDKIKMQENLKNNLSEQSRRFRARLKEQEKEAATKIGELVNEKTKLEEEKKTVDKKVKDAVKSGRESLVSFAEKIKRMEAQLLEQEEQAAKMIDKLHIGKSKIMKENETLKGNLAEKLKLVELLFINSTKQKDDTSKKIFELKLDKAKLEEECDKQDAKIADLKNVKKADDDEIRKLQQGIQDLAESAEAVEKKKQADVANQVAERRLEALTKKSFHKSELVDKAAEEKVGMLLQDKEDLLERVEQLQEKLLGRLRASISTEQHHPDQGDDLNKLERKVGADGRHAKRRRLEDSKRY